MNEVKLFENEEFGLVRTVTIDGEPWFVGRDIATSLGYAKPQNAIRDNVDEDDARMEGVIDSLGREQQTLVVNESGMYSLILRSQLASAKKFKHWVTSEVLPSIRKNGGYISGQETLSDDDLLEKALLVAQRRIDEKNAIIKEQQKEIIEKDQIIAVNKDKVEYFDAVLDSKLLTNFRDAGKQLGMSQTQFTGFLKNKGFIYATRRGELRPTEPYRDSGLFQMKSYVNRSSGFSGIQTYLTVKGIQYFRMMFEDKGIIPDALPKHGGRNAKKKTK